jgi:tRNA threonylcarbamoyladenosine biosynthesis protein TsaB
VALILSIESSADFGSVALHHSGKLISKVELSEERQHATNLAPSIDTLLKQTNTSLKSIDAVAVSKGPGSYTGLRIGVSMAKGICYSLKKEIIGINTLDVIAVNARQFAQQDDLLCPMIDARRMEVYCKLLDVNLNEIIPTTSVIIEDQLFADKLDNTRILFFGDGSEKCHKYFNSKNAVFIKNISQNAEALGQLAYKKFLNQDFESLNEFEPFYLKEFFYRNPVA